MTRRILLSIAGLMIGSKLLLGQSVEDHLAAGREFSTKNPPAALAAFEAVLAVDSTNYEANWGAAQALVMLVGAALGGYYGAFFAQKMKAQHVRYIVIASGASMSLYFFAKQGF